MSTRQAHGRPIAIDLFAGAGGLSLGLESAGFRVAASVEIDPIHAAIHHLNFPQSTTICADVRELSGQEIRKRAELGREVIDLVAGGPPCQGFSLIGRRVLTDPRNELVFHFLRLVAELKPRLFMMENVPGMATGAHHELLDELVEGFEDAGYTVRTPIQILNAMNYGVPQDRSRLVILGARRGTKLPEYPVPSFSGIGSRANQRGRYRQVVPNGLPRCPTSKEAIQDLPHLEKYPSTRDSDVLVARLGRGSDYALRLRGDARDPQDFSQIRKQQVAGLTGCLVAQHTARTIERFSQTTPGAVEPVSRFLRLNPQGPCNTLRAGTASDRGAFTAPRPIHFSSPRCISVREAARLHSYPDWFRFHKTIWHGFRQIGNSVPPLLGRAIGRVLIATLGSRPTRPAGALLLGDESLAGLDMSEAAAYFGIDSPIAGRTRQVSTSR